MSPLLNRHAKRSMSDTKFWVEDPCILIKDLHIFPTAEMTRDEKLNALTRLSIIIAIIMYVMGYRQWFTFLILAFLIVVLLKYVKMPKEVSKEGKIEHFTVVPTYPGTDFQQTVVSPTFSEEWQIPPPAYDIYTQVPYPNAQDRFEAPLKPQSYPYGQYLTRTNLLPADEYYTHLGCGGPIQAREYINSTFLRHDLAFRDNMIRIYKKSLNRRFRHNCQDTFSPYHSY